MLCAKYAETVLVVTGAPTDSPWGTSLSSRQLQEDDYGPVSIDDLVECKCLASAWAYVSAADGQCTVFQVEHTPTKLSKAVGAALFAMTKCNNLWPAQIVHKVSDNEDSLVFEFADPLTHEKVEDPVTLNFGDVHNINPEIEEVPGRDHWLVYLSV